MSIKTTSITKSSNSIAMPTKTGAITKSSTSINRKPQPSNMKQSSSQHDVKKASAAVPKVELVPATLPQPKTASNPTPSQADDDDFLEPTPRIRSGSYTVLKSDLNSNTIGKSLPEATDHPSSIPDDQQLKLEKEFRSNIGKLVENVNGQCGVLRYFGPVHFLDGLYCGVELDRETGTHDGQIDGRRYFQTAFKRGTFWPMERVVILPSPSPDLNMIDFSMVSSITSDVWKGELLTDVQQPSRFINLEESIMTTSDLTGSLSFLKGSRLQGMDVSMTPDELLAQLQIGVQENKDDPDITTVIEDESDSDDAQKESIFSPNRGPITKFSARSIANTIRLIPSLILMTTMRFQRKLNEANFELNSLNLQLDNHVNENRSLKSDYDHRILHQQSKFKTEMNRLKGQNQKLEKHVQTLRVDWEKKKRELGDAQRKMDEFNDQLRTKEKRIQELERKLSMAVNPNPANRSDQFDTAADNSIYYTPSEKSPCRP